MMEGESNSVLMVIYISELVMLKIHHKRKIQIVLLERFCVLILILRMSQLLGILLTILCILMAIAMSKDSLGIKMDNCGLLNMDHLVCKVVVMKLIKLNSVKTMVGQRFKTPKQKKAC